ncbi:hypothetical protein ABIE85_004563 [Bradyrhizobium diazoefficiens]|jgi:hypothetical protein|uniref:hypothetical protein n=1 Tax=Bradyrhizobium TaxID=374 RepID=UPI001B6823D2|nr:hypothetical protein [Bradyrhizobium japonicum]
MKLLFASVFFATALFAAATTVPHSPPLNRAAATTGMGSLHDLHRTIDINELPIEEFEDMSLVYSTKH